MPNLVDENAGQVYSECGAKIISNSGKYIFSFTSVLLRQIVSIIPWVSQYKYEKDKVSQVVSFKEAMSQIVLMEENL